MKINMKQFNKWIEALRSGKYKQSIGRLDSPNGFCCLGVACKVLIKPSNLTSNNDGTMCGGMPDDQKYSPSWLKEIPNDFVIKTSSYLQNLNDKEYFSFDEIADCLEAVYIHKVLD